MKKLSAVLCLALVLGSTLNAQNRSENILRNGVYAEFYLLRHDFSDGFVSLNYERIIGKKGKSALRAGIYPDFQSTISFPLTYTRITGPQRIHHFEYGLGAVIRIERFQGNTYKDIPAIMIPLVYRYQKSNRFFLRAGVNTFLSWPVLPSPSLSIGYKI